MTSESIDESTVRPGDTITGTWSGLPFPPTEVVLADGINQAVGVGNMYVLTPRGARLWLDGADLVITGHTPAVPPNPAWHDWPVVSVGGKVFQNDGKGDVVRWFHPEPGMWLWLSDADLAAMGTPQRVEMVALPEDHGFVIVNDDPNNLDSGLIEDSYGLKWGPRGARDYAARLIAAALEAEAGK